MLGLKRGTVILCDHEKEWEHEAQKTILKLKKILGNVAKDIQHIGSTSIPVIKAKPIIDIVLAVEELNNIISYEYKLKNAGFYYRPNVHIKNQLLFAGGNYYDGSGDLQTHFIHVVTANSMEWINYINFRDYLKNNISVAREYESLKLYLASQIPEKNGRELYLKGKHDFITNTLKDALTTKFIGQTIDKSCGTVLYTVINDVIYYLLIESPDHEYFGFPKGHMEYGETEEETALRETWEETSIIAKINKTFKRYIIYQTSSDSVKTVVYFPAYYFNQSPVHNNGFESYNYHLLPFEDAYQTLSFENTKALLKEINDFLNAN